MEIPNEQPKQIAPEFLGDPSPFMIDDYLSEWSRNRLIEKVPEERSSFVRIAHSFSRPFLSQGYNSAAALNRGLAAFSAHLDAISDFVGISTGLEKEGLFEEAARLYEDNAEYWKQRADKVGIGFVDEIVSEAVGGFVPGVSQFVLDLASGLTFPYMDGAAQAYKRGEDPFSAGMLEAAKTGTLAGIFRMIHPLKQYLRAPLMGTVFGIQESEGMPKGKKLKAFVKGAAIGAGYSMSSPGGRMGLNEVREAMKPAINKFVTDMKSERGAIGIEKPSAKPKAAKEPILMETYEALKDEKGYSSVEIADLRDRLGITQAEMERIIKGDPEHFATASGDWSLSSEHVRSGAVEMLPGKKDLLVKVREGAKIEEKKPEPIPTPAPAEKVEPATKPEAAKEPWEMTKKEFVSKNPHVWHEGYSRESRSDAFDKLSNDAEVWVYHATDNATADAFLANGIKISDKPSTLTREQFKAGEGTHFAPGKGLGEGLYVGSDPLNVDGYGRRVLAIKVKKGDIQISPEQSMLGEKSVGEALSLSDASVISDIASSQIIDVSTGKAGKPAHETFVKKALSEGKSVPESVLADYPDLKPQDVIPPSITEEGQKRPRKFLKRVEESVDIEPGLKEILEKLDPQDYLVQPNAESLAKANERIKTEGLDKTVDFVLSEAELSAEKGATFITLMERFQKEGDFDRAVQMIEAYDMQLREAGRFVQAASLFSRGSPQIFIRWANKQLKAVENKYGWADTLFGRKPESFSLSKEEQKVVMEKYREINELPEGANKIDATLQLIDMVAKKVPPSVSELIDAYRYQNMLSSIRTQMRNVGENVFNTFISKPVDITTRGGIDYFKSLLTGKDREVYVKDVAVYMKTAINAVPNAVHAFVETLKLSRTADIGKPELGIEAKGEFQRARAKQMPTALILVQRFMEAADKFNMALIGAGEMAVQKKRGLSDADAYRKATKAAEEYLYRGKLDPTDPRLSYPSQLLASLGKMMEGSRKLPGLGTLSKWYVPFLKTPINKGIQMVERSPIGALRDPKQLADAEIQAKLLSGAVVTALGAIAAMTGQTTWAPPTDPKEKALYYAAGRKPFSVMLFDKWIPLWYLGPFALAFGIPMAIKHYTVDRKQALTGGAIDRISEIANGLSQFIGSQSSTQSIGALFSALSGDINFTFSQQTGFTVQQIIPATSLIRYINTIIDPVYRKPEGFVERIEANLPFLSQKLDARMTPLFEESRRETINYFLPYDIGTSKELYEGLLPLERYNIRQRYLEGRVNDITKRLRNNDLTPEESMKEIIKIMQATPKSLEMLGEELNK